MIWSKTPESTTDRNQNGYLHWSGIVGNRICYQIRFCQCKGFNLTHIASNKIWHRDDPEVLKRIGEKWQNYIVNGRNHRRVKHG